MQTNLYLQILTTHLMSHYPPWIGQLHRNHLSPQPTITHLPKTHRIFHYQHHSMHIQRPTSHPLVWERTHPTSTFLYLYPVRYPWLFDHGRLIHVTPDLVKDIDNIRPLLAIRTFDRNLATDCWKYHATFFTRAHSVILDTHPPARFGPIQPTFYIIHLNIIINFVHSSTGRLMAESMGSDTEGICCVCRCSDDESVTGIWCRWSHEQEDEVGVQGGVEW
jgi:hypothetical protein